VTRCGTAISIRALLLCCACACTDSPRRETAASAPAEPEAAPKVAAAAGPAAAQAEAPQLFGAPLDPGTPELSLAQLLAAPAAHDGKTVRTRGTIARVCQRMGCWMELQAKDAPNAVRIPMADHAYFLPQSVVGRAAEIQGTVKVAALSEGHKRHLAAEGAQATESELSIAATGVQVR
jgi:hypothetical protein